MKHIYNNRIKMTKKQEEVFNETMERMGNNDNFETYGMVFNIPNEGKYAVIFTTPNDDSLPVEYREYPGFIITKNGEQYNAKIAVKYNDDLDTHFSKPYNLVTCKIQHTFMLPYEGI